MVTNSTAVIILNSLLLPITEEVCIIVYVLLKEVHSFITVFTEWSLMRV